MAQKPQKIDNDFASGLRDNVQGDILGDGLPKQVELFYFFKIDQPADFRKKLNQVVPLIASVRDQENERARIDLEKANVPARSDVTAQEARDMSVPSRLANIGFSSAGLQKLRLVNLPQDSSEKSKFDINLGPHLKDGTKDDPTPIPDYFALGMQADAVDGLRDPPVGDSKVPTWDGEFLGKQIDGVLLIAANDDGQALQKLVELLTVFGTATTYIKAIWGSARQGQLRRHEHFGFLDGISEPGVRQFDIPKQDLDNNDQEDILDKTFVSAGVILCKQAEDPGLDKRPDWTKDGSFLAFRYLDQKVPEFNAALGGFAAELGMPDTSPVREEIGARIIGRWPSGALLTTNPDRDPLPLSKQINMSRAEIDAILQKDNRVKFGETDKFDDFSSLGKCPLGAHIRKMNPRVLGTANRIVRRGIQFGPEVDAPEAASGKTSGRGKRGLLFACYQSSLENGYRFIQHQWANNKNFPPPNGTIHAGIDPMVGQDNLPGKYTMSSMNKRDENATISIPHINPFVQPLGGEYFFMPSMKALRTVLADTSSSNGNGANPSPRPVQTVVIFVENRVSGARPSRPLPFDGKSHTFAELFGPSIAGNFVGVNGQAPANAVIEVSGGVAPFKLNNNGTPSQLGAGAPVDISAWKILGKI